MGADRLSRQGDHGDARAHGIEVFFSRCLTLSLPGGGGAVGDDVFIVDGQHPVDRSLIPSRLVEKAQSRGHYVPRRLCGDNVEKRAMAATLLEEYRHARLVITNLLHCAMPCVAMGVPVVFFSPYPPGHPEMYRLDPVSDLLPLHQPGDVVDWAPDPPDVAHIARELSLLAAEAVTTVSV